MSEHGPQLWYVGLILFLVVLFHVVGLLLAVTEPVRAALSPWAMLGAGAVAAIVMGGYLLWAHPRLRAQLRDDEETLGSQA
jgi:hypothetical protein